MSSTPALVGLIGASTAFVGAAAQTLWFLLSRKKNEAAVRQAILAATSSQLAEQSATLARAAQIAGRLATERRGYEAIREPQSDESEPGGLSSPSIRSLLVAAEHGQWKPITLIHLVAAAEAIQGSALSRRSGPLSVSDWEALYRRQSASGGDLDQV